MMYPDPTIRDIVGFKANTLNLAEELGQVDSFSGVKPAPSPRTSLYSVP